MDHFTSLIFLSLTVFVCISGHESEFLYDVFPSNFKWGFATASYQIEGGWNEDGKGPNIWDDYTHRNISPIDDGSNGDIACDSYHKFEVDVNLLKNMGADIYRFSLSWARIFPNATTTVNPAGIEYYNKLIDLLIENEIEPMITLYHWDLPSALQSDQYGGWPDARIIPAFLEFAELSFNTFGDRVKKWITFNEPWVVCYQGYEIGSKAPGIKDVNQSYMCAHNIIKAHGKAYRLYESKYKEKQKGVVGITLDCGWYEPKNASDPNDLAASERALQFKHGWFGSPLTWGKYPTVMKEYIDAASIEEGLESSRLPEFTADEITEITGTLDFIGLNHYTTELVESQRRPEPGWDGDQDLIKSFDPSWPESSAVWLKVVPFGFRHVLGWISTTYANPEIYVTENGFADRNTSGTNDAGRVSYYQDYINEMLKAVKLDGVNVTVYTAWSLMDNYEWARGYTQRFGTHFVDFEDPERTRTPKDSAILLKKIFEDNGFPKKVDTGEGNLVTAMRWWTICCISTISFILTH